jgi:ABC-2 type transport system ATP-binding protein
MTVSEAVVEVHNLRKAYHGVEALRGIDFEIRRGETFALLGPNGAGKSTTIEILEGYRDRSSGQVSVLGVDPQRGGLDWKARLGIVLQSGGEQGNATVREQLTHFAGFYPSKASSRIKLLSGGQRRRVDVALGIIGRPELLFLDEPTTGFDPEARRQFWALIEQLKAEGTTILLTTHYLDEAAQLSDRAGIVADGRLVEIGAIDTIGGTAARIPIVRWTRDGQVHEERAERPGQFVARLVADGEPERLEVIRPSLEDIYLELVGAADIAAAERAASIEGASK